MNFWIDVTNTCKSAINSGVPRTVRGIYQILKTHGTVTPLRWDNHRSQYCLLTSQEKRALDGDTTARPSKWWRGVSRHWTAIDLPSLIQKEDYFVQVEIFQDLRNEWIKQYHSQFKSFAIFHDAIAWSHPHLTALKRQPRFDDYMKNLHLFTHVITISEESSHALQDLWTKTSLPSGKPLHILPWPVDFPENERGGEEIPTKATILSVSTFEQRKNHLTLLHAAEKLWSEGLDFQLVLLGKKCPHWGVHVVKEIDRLQSLGRSVLWKNQVSDPELHAAYRDSRFTVYPSLIEGFGLPILESLWHHRPCICAHTGAIAETAGAGGCLTIDISSSDALADAMKKLLTDSLLFEELRKKTFQIQFQSWKEYGNKLSNILSLPKVDS